MEKKGIKRQLDNLINSILRFDRYPGMSWKAFRVLTLAFYVAAASILFVYILGQYVYRHPVFPTNECSYIREFSYKTSTGQSGQITLPCAINAEKEEELVLFSTIPDDIRDGMYLCYVGGKSTTIYIDGEKRFEFSYTDMEFPGRVLKSVYFPIKVSESDRGKELKIVKNEPVVKRGTMNAIMYGYPDAIKNEVYKDYKFPMILNIFLATFSVVLMIAGWYVGVRNDGELSVRVLGFGVFLVAAWLICDSKGYQFLFNNIFVDGIVEYMLLLVIPFPFMRYMNIVQKRRYELLYTVTAIIDLILYSVFAVLNFTDIQSYEQSRLAMNICLLVIFAEIIIVMIIDGIHGYLKDYLPMYWGYGVFIVFVIMEIITIFIDTNASNGTYVMVGLFALLLAATVYTSSELRLYEAARQKAIYTSMVKTNFLTNMSHEIRTPINTIIGMNEMISRENKKPEIAEYSEHIKKSSELLLGIISDVLDLSKVEAGKLEIIDSPYDTASFIDAIVGVLKERASDKSLEYVLDIDESLPCKFTGDEIRIQQIVLNLISNAVKYTENGSVTLEIKGNELIDGQFEILISVKDTGIGIKEEDISHLFDSFARFDEKKNKHIQGTGLGLSITKTLVDALRGTITIESEYNVGSTFTVRIPQTVIDSTPIGNSWINNEELVQEYRESFSANDVCILAVDDNASNLMIINQYLKKTGINVETASGGIEALSKCYIKKYDLILLDHMMPEMDGVEVVETLKNNPNGINYETPTIVLTANALSGSREEYISKGFIDYLSKPIDYRLLEEMVCKYLPDDKVIRNVIPENTQHEEVQPKINNDSDGTRESSENKMGASSMLDAIDRDKMIEMFGDESFVDEIIKKVATDSLTALDRMKEAMANEDYSTYAIDAHGIKGMMASIYHEPLRAWSKEHEFAAKENRIDYIKDDYDKYRAEVIALCNAILEE